jgi:hypothetical protein
MRLTSPLARSCSLVRVGFSHPIPIRLKDSTGRRRGPARIDIDCIQLAEHGQSSEGSHSLFERGMPLVSGQLVHILVPKLRQVSLSKLPYPWNTRSSPRRLAASSTNPLRLTHPSNSDTA